MVYLILLVGKPCYLIQVPYVRNDRIGVFGVVVTFLEISINFPYFLKTSGRVQNAGAIILDLCCVSVYDAVWHVHTQPVQCAYVQHAGVLSGLLSDVLPGIHFADKLADDQPKSIANRPPVSHQKFGLSKQTHFNIVYHCRYHRPCYSLITVVPFY